MSIASYDSADLSAAVESLHRAHVLLRLAGPLAEPEPGRGVLPWMSWLKSAEAEREGRLVATSHRLAAKGAYREIPLASDNGYPSLPHPVKPDALVQWMLSARHPRPLARWCESALESESTPVAPAVVVAVAMSAFHFPRHEAISVWFYLRWRAAWQSEVWPGPRDFLVASGRVLPLVRRRLLRYPFGPAVTGAKSQAARL